MGVVFGFDGVEEWNLEIVLLSPGRGWLFADAAKHLLSWCVAWVCSCVLLVEHVVDVRKVVHRLGAEKAAVLLSALALSLSKGCEAR